MPTYRITDPKSGKTLKIDGPAPPSEAVLQQMFAQLGSGEAEPDTPVEPSVKDPGWPGRYPTVAAATRVGLDALPAVGGIVGGALATPETLGAGTLLGAGGGAAVGRGLRDVLAEQLGLDDVTSPMDKAGAMAWDAALTMGPGYVLAKAAKFANSVGTSLKGLRVLAKSSPEIRDQLIRTISPGIADRVKSGTEVAQSLRTLATAAPGASTADVPSPPKPVRPMAPSPTPVAQAPQTFQPNVERLAPMKGAKPLQKLYVVMEEAERQGLPRLSATEMDAGTKLIAQGMDPVEAYTQILTAKTAGSVSPDAAFAAKFGTPTDAEMKAEFGRQARSGKKSLMAKYGTE